MPAPEPLVEIVPECIVTEALPGDLLNRSKSVCAISPAEPSPDVEIDPLFIITVELPGIDDKSPLSLTAPTTPSELLPVVEIFTLSIETSLLPTPPLTRA